MASNSNDEPIFVTRPFLPPLEEVLPHLESIWSKRVLTNQGPLHQRLEAGLATFLGVDRISLTANGMLALEAALEAANLDGEVITTPYSFVATTHAIRRAGLEPVFADIRDHDLNIDPERVERAITPRTSAIVAVHCYGNPCTTGQLEEIAQRHGLTLIYDAAHAFGVEKDGRTILSEGDFSALSFHATKAFNTFEGGAVISSSAERKQAIDRIRNFGIVDELNIPDVGGNAKMNEFNAAIGLVQLTHFEEVRVARGKVDAAYRAALLDVPGIDPIETPSGVRSNFSYFPVRVRPEYPLSRDDLYDRLKANGIFSRRYFYPLLSTLPAYRDLASALPSNLPVASEAAGQILCLPIYHDLAIEDQERIIDLIRG